MNSRKLVIPKGGMNNRELLIPFVRNGGMNSHSDHHSDRFTERAAANYKACPEIRRRYVRVLKTDYPHLLVIQEHIRYLDRRKYVYRGLKFTLTFKLMTDTLSIPKSF